MKISVYSLSVSDKTVDQVIESSQLFGCDGIEWWCRENGHIDASCVEKSATEVSKKMHDSSLAVAGLAPYFSYTEKKDALKPIFHAARILDTHNIRCHSHRFDGEKAYSELFFAQRRWMEEEVFPVAEEFDIQLNIEQHHNQICCTPQACVDMVKGFPKDRFGIIYDPGNSQFEGYTRASYAISVMGSFLAHVHVKSCGPSSAEEGVVPPGRIYPQRFWSLEIGDLNWREIIEELHKAGYTGYLSLEALDKRSSDQKLQEDIPFLKKILSSVLSR
jgi:sugar phosphate isomerase/epimerase